MTRIFPESELKYKMYWYLRRKETYFRFKIKTSCNGKIMDLEILKILYKFGKISALTSLYIKKKKLNHLQRYQTFLIFALYLVGVI
jgi:hypothetical protein